jgi:hypothetical protein
MKNESVILLAVMAYLAWLAYSKRCRPCTISGDAMGWEILPDTGNPYFPPDP